MRTTIGRRARSSPMQVLPTNCGPMIDPGQFTEDAFLGGQLRLRQPKSGHGAGQRILKSGGVLSLIWRADGLSEMLAGLERGFGSLGILPVHPDQAKPAIRVLVRAIKGGRAPTQIHPALMLNDESALPNKQVQEILAGKKVLTPAKP